MSNVETVSYDGTTYVKAIDLADALGITRETLYDRLARAGCEVYSDPSDRRIRLVRVVDTAKIAGPQPVSKGYRARMAHTL